jgi:hypothetical protein
VRGELEKKRICVPGHYIGRKEGRIRNRRRGEVTKQSLGIKSFSIDSPERFLLSTTPKL